MPLEKTVKLDFVDHCSINEPMVSLDHWFDVHRVKSLLSSGTMTWLSTLLAEKKDSNAEPIATANDTKLSKLK